MAIHTPPASRTVRKTSSSAEMPTSSAISTTALNSLLDDLFRRLRLRLFVTWWIAAHDVDEFVDKGDKQNQEAAAVSELRNPQRHRQYTLSHVVKAPGIVGLQRGVIGKESNEEPADQQRGDFDNVAGATFQPIDQKSDPDHLAVTKRVRQPQK